MANHSENLSQLIGDWGLVIPNTAPAVNQILKVSSVDIANKTAAFTYSALSAFDPIATVALNAATKILTITTAGGVNYTADMTPVSTALTSVVENAGNLDFHFSDGSIVTFTPTLFDPALKADKTTKIISNDVAAISITNPTLADDVTLNIHTNTANGLAKLSATSNLAPVTISALKSESNFLAIPSTTYDASSGVTPTGKDGDALMIGVPGVLNVVPFGGSAAVAHTMAKGDIIRMISGIWHIVTRSEVSTLAATAITTAAIGTPSLGANVQQVLLALYNGTVPITRKVKSANINELTVNGAVEDVIDKDITIALVTNAPNGLLQLDSTGLIPASKLPASAFEFHGVIDATAAMPLTRPDGVTPWTPGDTLEVTIGTSGGYAAFQFIASGSLVVGNGPLAAGDILVRNSSGAWAQTSNGGAVPSGKVTTASAVIGLTNILAGATSLASLNDVIQSINNNAVWLAGAQTVSGVKKFTGGINTAALQVGANTGVLYTMPTARSLVAGYTLVTDLAGTVTWSKLLATNVTFTPFTGVAGTNAQTVIKEVFDAAVKLVPNAIQILQGDSAGNYTKLQSNSGVIMGDGTTSNQLGNMIFSAGSC